MTPQAPSSSASLYSSIGRRSLAAESDFDHLKPQREPRGKIVECTGRQEAATLGARAARRAVWAFLTECFHYGDLTSGTPVSEHSCFKFLTPSVLPWINQRQPWKQDPAVLEWLLLAQPM
jgi:hypothetical protein